MSTARQASVGLPGWLFRQKKRFLHRVLQIKKGFAVAFENADSREDGGHVSVTNWNRATNRQHEAANTVYVSQSCYPFEIQDGRSVCIQYGGHNALGFGHGVPPEGDSRPDATTAPPLFQRPK